MKIRLVVFPLLLAWYFATAKEIVLGQPELYALLDTSPKTFFPARFDHVARIRQIYRNGEALLSVDGLCDEFGLDGVGVYGYEQAGKDGVFLKIGVGLLQSDGAPAYKNETPYRVVKTFPISVQSESNLVKVSQRVQWKNIAYFYTKLYQINTEKKVLRITWILRNEGKEPLAFTHYNHNYFRFAPRGSCLRVNFPLPPAPPYTFISTGNGFLTPMKSGAYWSFDFEEKRFVQITLPHRVRIRPGCSIFRFAFYADDTCFAPELFVRRVCLPSQETSWYCDWFLDIQEGK